MALWRKPALARSLGAHGARECQIDRVCHLCERGLTSEHIVEERFLHWQVTFPGVWSEWDKDTLTGGFDAIIGNPPWDRMKLEDVEWFAARRREIALAQRAADRKRMIVSLEKNGDPLARDYAKAEARAEAGARAYARRRSSCLR